MKKKENIVIVSGYFNPLHKGHVEMIEKAAKLGKVVVIVNNDLQVSIKGSIPFMDHQERAYIAKSLKGVIDVWVAQDKDEAVIVTLRKIVAFYRREKDKKGEYKYNFIFGNGGDRVKGNVPEAGICKQLGIRMVYGLGQKVQSSSELISKARNY